MLTKLRERLWRQRQQVGEFWWYSLVNLAMQPAAIVLNFFVGLWLVPKLVNQQDLGAILPLGQVAAVLAVPLGLLMTPFGKYLNTFLTRGEMGKAKSLLADACRVSVVLALVLAAYTAICAPFVLERMHLSGVSITVMLCLMAFIGGVKPVFGNAVLALKRFNSMTIAGAITAPLRFLLVWGLAAAFSLTGYLGAQVLLEAILMLVLVHSLARLLRPVARESYREHWREILAYSQPLMITGIIGALAGLCLPWVIRQRLPVEESAAYFILTRFSEISGYVGTTVNTMMFPMASERHERGQSTSRLLWQAALANALFGGAVVVALGVLGHWVLGLRPEWADYQKFSHLLWILALVRTLEMTAAAFWTNEMVCRRVGLIWGITALDTLMAVILYSLAGWGFFRPYLPPEVWTAVDRLGVCRLEFVVKFALVAQLLRLPVIAVVFWHHRRRASGSPAPA